MTRLSLAFRDTLVALVSLSPLSTGPNQRTAEALLGPVEGAGLRVSCSLWVGHRGMGSVQLQTCRDTQRWRLENAHEALMTAVPGGPPRNNDLEACQKIQTPWEPKGPFKRTLEQTKGAQPRCPGALATKRRKEKANAR